MSFKLFNDTTSTLTSNTVTNTILTTKTNTHTIMPDQYIETFNFSMVSTYGSDGRLSTRNTIVFTPVVTYNDIIISNITMFISQPRISVGLFSVDIPNGTYTLLTSGTYLSAIFPPLLNTLKFNKPVLLEKTLVYAIGLTYTSTLDPVSPQGEVGSSTLSGSTLYFNDPEQIIDGILPKIFKQPGNGLALSTPYFRLT
jgi:hypothetical protein